MSRHARFEEGPQSDDIERKPGQREQNHHHNEHLQNLGLDPEDVALGPRTEETPDPTTPYPDPDQQAEDDDEGQRDEVASEKDDSDGEGLARARVAPVGVAGNVGVAGDEESRLVVDEDPGNEGERWNEPDEEDDQRSTAGRHLRRVVGEYRQIPGNERMNG